MKCPKCSSHDTRVVDSRDTSESTIRRRRQCIQCEHRFTTLEEVLRDEIWVIKRDGRREKFSREKICSGIEKALEKRPVSTQQVETLVDQITDELCSQYTDIPCKAIGESIMNHLKGLDPIAYVRFASVYKDFRSVEDFVNAIHHLETTP
ncbi:MAG: transcriptional regulator NrdR [Verrucomicrobia bacterium GWF2_51_19]|nr:MAG: transcriptional regulator NrdR [Verrucomicrobia bacterium GWF2_51_19]HCJ12244.1 transcriptional regulator NrdR [Opitutae bacterium]